MLTIFTKSWATAAASTMLALPLWCTAGEQHVDGANEFRTYCAVCHGIDGRGDGPMADKLIRRPNDLTLLSKNNGGSFPETVIYQIIDGRRIVLFHGSTQMPIWGDRFRDIGEQGVVGVRISALVSHVESIQAR